MNNNSFVDFITRPITLTIILVALGLLVWGIVKRAQMHRRIAANEVGGGS
jgi:Tfp pilus assembly protein PilX